MRRNFPQKLPHESARTVAARSNGKKLRPAPGRDSLDATLAEIGFGETGPALAFPRPVESCTVSLPNQEPATVARRFVEAVNGRDADKILAHTTDDHVFIDSLGFRTTGRGPLREAWAAYFKMIPDFRISLDQVIEHGEVVVAFGAASGTWRNSGPPRPENRWSTPAAWRAVVRSGQVAEWRVYSDNEPLRAIMRRNGAA